MVTKVISGGQTGIDQLALEIAYKYGIPTGGTAPKGYRTEQGPMPRLLRDKYGLSESPYFQYGPRTAKNVKDSDATIIYGNMLSPGTKLTIQICTSLRKQYITNPTYAILLDFICDVGDVKVLNVAGNRASTLGPEHKGLAQITLDILFSTLKQT